MNKFEDIMNGVIVNVVGLEEESEEVILTIFKNNKFYELRIYHEQECCEDVRLLEYHGKIDLNSQLLDIKVISNEEVKENGDSQTWTFITIETNTSTCTLRFLGESNGYYSESVDFSIR